MKLITKQIVNHITDNVATGHAFHAFRSESGVHLPHLAIESRMRAERIMELEYGHREWDQPLLDFLESCVQKCLMETRKNNSDFPLAAHRANC